ncbi:TIGR00266 family protein [Tissierella sp. MSJ-40]|uniref:TIGR00266 family protein n=1 Tax=Tissierella simiarum TaxID=2841534 RepID=A0ABS6EAG2_9FIRM|nr:TIGR00266 family protein [Tissierella simiarum]MBU5439922.1 TIGR00266 family protein [Tissierella simiarum]
MEYEIKGANLPVVICRLNSGEKIVSQAGAMGWMSENIKMDTNMKGGLMGGIGRMFSGESLFLNTFASSGGPGIIAFPSSFPGRILALELKSGESIIAQKDAFLAAEESVTLEVYFKKKISSGLFGGEGFILQKITGPGIVFLEFDGHIEEYDLASRETMRVDTGHVAMFESSVEFDVVSVKGMKNVLFGGEGLFLTTLTGPGKVYLQTMPIQNLAGQIYKIFPSKPD